MATGQVRPHPAMDGRGQAPQEERFGRRKLLLGVMGVSVGAFMLSFTAVPLFVTKVLELAVQEIAVGDQLVYSAVGLNGAAAGTPVRAGDLQQGASVQAFPKGKADNQQNLIEIVRVAAGSGKEGLVAYSAICTHLGCVVQAKLLQGQVVCPCHNSHYDPANNAMVVSGPSPRPLPSLPIDVGPDGVITAAGPFSAKVGVE